MILLTRDEAWLDKSEDRAARVVETAIVELRRQHSGEWPSTIGHRLGTEGIDPGASELD